ncbi:MAG: type I methionyl aminopeptidase [Actinomycetota bacterium]|nr:type I methionyl aminopeptidase [Actinomycetota bacterium]
MIIIRSGQEIDKMRRAGEIVSRVFDKLKGLIVAGLTTLEMDRIIEEIITGAKGVPAFKGYRGYPASSCISLNEVVVHGIPGPRQLKEGDIVGVDVGVKLNGYFADAAYTYGVGRISNEAKDLIETTKRALFAGIDQCKEGRRLYDISSAIQKMAEGAGYSAVRDFVGHGIGSKLHEDPQVPNYGTPHTGPMLKKGMVFAIEPMINGGGFAVKVAEDNWTVTTLDGSLSAHFEHTVAVGEEGPDILTFW